MSFDTVIEMEDLARHYEMGGVTIKALDGVDLSIFRGEYLSIVGPSGSGKTLEHWITQPSMQGCPLRPSPARLSMSSAMVSPEMASTCLN